VRWTNPAGVPSGGFKVRTIQDHDRQLSVEERRQEELFDKLADGYERHYSDRFSSQWRSVCVNHRLTSGIGLAGSRVLDAMCGGGQNTEHLSALGAQVYGLDLSLSMVRTFAAHWPRSPVVQGSGLNLPFLDESFDHVVITGGLHHLHPQVDQAVDEVHRILKPKGWFVFLEPHAGSIADVFRKLWYRVDPIFESNERAIDAEQLWARHRGQFDAVSIEYGGNLACLLVNQSFVLRMPTAIKRLYARPLIRLERLCQPLINKRAGMFVIAKWRKR
jgi:ubiquinone/menaquinone biosynthesis C-methylase UbiE